LAHTAGGYGSAAKLLSGLCTELRKRLQMPPGDDRAPSASDLCLVAHAYAHTSQQPDKALFKDLRDQLLQGVVLVELGAGELANLANAFSKLAAADKNGHVELFGRLGNQLVQSSPLPRDEASALRTACVALNAFSQASVRHEPYFLACQEALPALLSDGNMRHLAMLAHAYVRVGLSQSSLLPLIWDHAIRLAPSCDGHSASLMIFAVTKASTADELSGRLLSVLSTRLLDLLKGPDDNELVLAQTLVVTGYALARGGYAKLVDPELWAVLAERGQRGFGELALTEVANLAFALAEAQKSMEDGPVFASFFASLSQYLELQILEGRTVRCPAPDAVAKLIIAFADAECFEAAGIVRTMARRCLLPSLATTGAPLRSVAQALSRLRLLDEDLLQALTMAQKPARRARPP